MGILKDDLNNKDISAERKLEMLKVRYQQDIIFEAHSLQNRLNQIGEKGIRIVVVTTDHRGNDHIIDPANRVAYLSSISRFGD